MNLVSEFVEALMKSDLERARQLRVSGADIDLRYDPNGWTALHYMVENMIVESARWLLENGANPNEQDANGWTALHLAIDIEGDVGSQTYVKTGAFPPSAQLTALLLMHGANPNAQSKNGLTPIALANRYRHNKAIDLLKRYGAREAGA